MRSRLKIPKLFVFATLFTVLGVSILFQQTAHAYLSDVSPAPKAVNPATNTLTHLVGSADYLKQAKSTSLAIYASSNKIEVDIYSANMCQGTIDSGGGGNIRDHIGTDLGSHASNNTTVGYYRLSAGASNSSVAAKRSSDCSVKTLSATSADAQVTTVGTLYKYVFNASWNLSCGNEDCGVNYFSVKAVAIKPNGNRDNGGNVVISQLGNTAGVDASQNGIGGYGNSSFSDYYVDFGAGCFATPTQDAFVGLYDDDNANGPGAQDPNRPFGLKLEQRATKGSGPWSVAPITSISVSDGNVVTPGSEQKPGILGRNHNAGGGWLEVGTNGSGNNFNLNFTAQRSYEYRLSIRNIDPHNNLQFSYPFEAIQSYVDCDQDTPNPQVVVNPQIDSVGDDNASDTQNNFTKSANVSNFPQVKDWGYTEVASKRGVFSGVKSYKVDYDANKLSQTSGRIQKLCAQGSFHVDLNDCPANGSGKKFWECFADESGTNQANGTACNAYFFKCVNTGMADKDVGYRYYFNAPSCTVIELGCKNGQGQNDTSGTLEWGEYVNKANYCHNKSNCPDPSKTPSDYGPDGVNMNCKIFYCAYNSNIVANQYYVDDPGPDLTNAGNRQQDIPCAKRCNNGASTVHAPREDETQGADLNCYQPAAFDLQCTWTEAEEPSKINRSDGQRIGASGYAPCSGAYSGAIGAPQAGNPLQLCATTTDGASGWVNGGGYLPPGLNPNGSYRRNWGVAIGLPARACVTLGIKPYFNVLGGDVVAGPGFGTGCTSGDASIIGSNKGTSPYDGSGSQLAAIALTSIKSFATGKAQSGQLGTNWFDSVAANGSPSELAFANTTTGGSLYGGNYMGAGGGSWCVPDYYAKAGPDTTTSLDVSTSGVITKEGDTTLAGGLVIPANGQNFTLKVHGNLYLKPGAGNGISFQSTTDIAKIPQFRVLVSGNIYVDPAIDRLDGFYAAQSSSQADGLAGGGYFISCAQSGAALLTATGTDAKACQKQLVINGGVAAEQLVFNRTLGDYRGKYGQQEQPAEVIRYSPSLWLPNLKRGDSLGSWQSVTSLPPIL